MLEKISLEGEWKLQLDAGKQGLRLPYTDCIELPNTTSHARKGEENGDCLLGSLTDIYAFEGYAWYEREVDIPQRLDGLPVFLFLERTRVTTVWVDGQEVGTRNSLSTPHQYELTGRLGAGAHTVTIRVDNTDYPTKGGHLTSIDTQTNWNGITGRIELQFSGQSYLTDVQVYAQPANRAVVIRAAVNGAAEGLELVVHAKSRNSEVAHNAAEQVFSVDSDTIDVQYELGEHALLWSDAHPQLYELEVSLRRRSGERLDRHELLVGLREFKAQGDKFAINGTKTFLRGKHDGLIFPLTGYAPTDVEEWLRIMTISKSYGINHYRFHTCCPPEAAFVAADLLGMYMEPELPFWGTVTDERDEQHNQAEQDYLISEGFAMLSAYGNHPSFVMMSLGNELWGSKERLNEILRRYKSFDNRHLYTAGSNNYQFVPDILEEEDFYCGVRFSRDRLIRGSYAMCDAPLGHIQTDRPSTLTDYDAHIHPGAPDDGSASGRDSGGMIQIQYGTEARTVKADSASAELIPQLPVVSHEIGQFASFPNFDEIDKYTGSLKARNYEVFRERLRSKGLEHLAQSYVQASGKLAAACYKEELEAAFRTSRLAGFQLLDLQDFSGQGTALVGMLDAFMDSKGFISPEEWRTFCSDAVLLARFEKYNYEAGERFEAGVELAYYRKAPAAGLKMTWSLDGPEGEYASGESAFSIGAGEHHIAIGTINCTMPAVAGMTQAVLSLAIEGTDIRKCYDLWLYPRELTIDWSGIRRFGELTEEAIGLLEQGQDILLLPDPKGVLHAIEGFYCTDFWCYPMFRSISQSMNKPEPVGTMGLLIDHVHPAFRDFPSVFHSTYPWWSIVSNSSSIIMDDLQQPLDPLVATIDNFERNHKLGLLFECRVLNGRVLAGALDADAILDTPEGRQFFYSLVQYMKSDHFRPQATLGVGELGGLVGSVRG